MKCYSAIKRNEILIYLNIKESLKILPTWKCIDKGQHVIWFHLYDMFRIRKSMEIEKYMGGCIELGRKEGEVETDWYWIKGFVWGQWWSKYFWQAILGRWSKTYCSNKIGDFTLQIMLKTLTKKIKKRRSWDQVVKTFSSFQCRGYEFNPLLGS